MVTKPVEKSPVIRSWLDELERPDAENAILFKEILSEKIGKNVSNDLGNDALWSLVIAAILILIYITIRFNGIFSLGSIIALIHDILITFHNYKIYNMNAASLKFYKC